MIICHVPFLDHCNLDLHARIQDFFQGGGGGGGGGAGPTARKQSGQFFFPFLVLNLIYRLQRGSKVAHYRENYTFPRIQRGSNIFQGGGSNFYQVGGGGWNATFYRNPYNLWFFRGVGGGGVLTPYPPSGSSDDLTYFFRMIVSRAYLLYY